MGYIVIVGKYGRIVIKWLSVDDFQCFFVGVGMYDGEYWIKNFFGVDWGIQGYVVKDCWVEKVFVFVVWDCKVVFVKDDF